MTVFLSILLLSLVAIVIDIGYAYYEQNVLNTAVKAACMAGKDRFLFLKKQKDNLTEEDNQQILNHAKEVFLLNSLGDYAKNVSINIELQNEIIKISCSKKIGLFFAKAINFDYFVIKANYSL